jgi:hypothetical protein
VPQILGDMKSIMNFFGGLRTEFKNIKKDVLSRKGIPIPFPKVFNKDILYLAFKQKKVGRK